MLYYLMTKRRQLPEHLVWSVLTQVSMALHRCHYGEDLPKSDESIFHIIPKMSEPADKQPGTIILHRDIKPENSNDNIRT